MISSPRVNISADGGSKNIFAGLPARTPSEHATFYIFRKQVSPQSAQEICPLREQEAAIFIFY